MGATISISFFTDCRFWFELRKSAFLLVPFFPPIISVCVAAFISLVWTDCRFYSTFDAKLVWSRPSRLILSVNSNSSFGNPFFEFFRIFSVRAGATISLYFWAIVDSDSSFEKKKNRSILQLFVLFIILKLVWFRLSSLNLTGGQFWFEFRKAFVFFLPIF